MSRETYGEGTATYSSTGKTTIHAFDGDVTFIAATKNKWSGKENGITEHNYVAPEKKEEEAKKEAKESVKEIELLTVLDDGSANDLSGKLQSGMILGKSYQFKIKSYAKDTPKDKSVIKWMLKYHSLSEDKWVEIPLSLKGDNIKIKMNEEDMCGQFVYIRAYLNDPETEGELKVWKHNRFRMLDRQQLVIETDLRANISSAIDQGGSSLCGIAVVGYYLARDQPKVYSKFISDMHRRGIAIIESNNYIVEIDKDEHLIQYKQSDKKFPTDSFRTGKMLTADFIFLVVIKDFLNNVFDYDPDDENVGEFVEGSTGLTLPGEVASIMKNIANYSDVINDTNLITSKWQSASTSAEKLQKKLTDGYKIGILIDSDNFTKSFKSKLTVPTHWVGLLNITNDEKSKQISITVFTWSSIRVWTVSYDLFEDGYFGYVGGK